MLSWLVGGLGAWSKVITEGVRGRGGANIRSRADKLSAISEQLRDENFEKSWSRGKYCETLAIAHKRESL
jgi:hypothetical protein